VRLALTVDVDVMVEACRKIRALAESLASSNPSLTTERSQ